MPARRVMPRLVLLFGYRIFYRTFFLVSNPRQPQTTPDSFGRVLTSRSHLQRRRNATRNIPRNNTVYPACTGRTRPRDREDNSPEIPELRGYNAQGHAVHHALIPPGWSRPPPIPPSLTVSVRDRSNKTPPPLGPQRTAPEAGPRSRGLAEHRSADKRLNIGRDQVSREDAADPYRRRQSSR